MDYNPDVEEKIRIALLALEKLLERWTEARNQGDKAKLARIEWLIVQAMRIVRDAYPDEEARQRWHRQAENFERAKPEEREHILMPIAGSMLLLTTAPLGLAHGIVGGVVFAAESILYGVGQVVAGLGSLLTGGMLR